MRPLRPVLMLTTGFPRHADDWMGRFVAEMAADLARQGHRVRVLAPGSGWAPPGVTRVGYRTPPGLLDGRGAPEALRARPMAAGLSAAGASASLLAAAVRRARVDEVLLGHWLVPSGPAALAAARLTGAPVHLVAHGSDVALLEGMPGGRTLARSLDAGAASITFVSADLQARFAALRGRPARTTERVQPMGVPAPAPDSRMIATLRQRAAGRRIVATVGRMAPIKGYDVLARALVGRSDVVWIAAGDGPERAKLVEACRRTDVGLHPLGAVGPATRDALLAVADVFVAPSVPVDTRREGTPVSILEALSAGVPVVASAIGGIPAVLEPAQGLLVPPGDGAALRAAIDRVLDDPDQAAHMAAAHLTAGALHRWASVGATFSAVVDGQDGPTTEAPSV